MNIGIQVAIFWGAQFLCKSASLYEKFISPMRSKVEADIESEGIMSPQINKLSKLDVHLGYMHMPLTTNFPIKVCLLCSIVR